MKLPPLIHVFLASCLLLLMNSSIPSNSQELTLPYMTSNPEEISGRSFDYIVVGGGATGCPLAATLSEKYSVLLIERGASPYNDPMISQSKNYGLPLIESDEFSSVAQSFVSEEGVMNVRGRVLGGSTAINSGFYSRASEDYVERVGWDKRLVREAYEWVESKVVFRPDGLSEWQSVLKDSLVGDGGLSFKGYSLEHIAGTKVGGSIFDANGRRHSSADLLSYGNLKKITVLLNATVKSLVFCKNDTKKVVGVKFIKSKGNADEMYETYINRAMNSESGGEVILSAGALGSPQILMLSGIGPREHLKHFNISSIVDLEEVGKDIKDNPSFSLLLHSDESLQSDVAQVVGTTLDFQVIIESVRRYVTHNTTGLQIGAKMTYPVSKGKLELKTTDPRQNPSVRYNYLSEERDMDQFLKMRRMLEKIAESSFIKSYLGRPQNENIYKSTEDEMRDSCRANVNTFYHNHGGCHIGYVVSKDYRVYGVEGLRVLDGSTLPDAPGTNPMATLLMLGRYQGIKMLEERGDTSITCSLEHDDQYITFRR